MHDPFPLAPPATLLPYVEKVSDYLAMKTLPLHYHEVMVAYAVYHTTNKYISPAFSRYFFPRTYSTLNARTKLNWDVHVVSFVQSVVICTLAIWVMWADTERSDMDTRERVHGYTGASGLIQAFAGGYFLWDLVITAQNFKIFGIGMLFHAISALCVFSLGFRPFVNFYAPTFILYELSSPFLNIHWFCDKLDMTGSTLQFVNGIVLLFTFFSCRLCWGTYNSYRVFVDVYRAYTTGAVILSDPTTGKLNANTTVGNAGFNHDVLQFAEGQTVPIWLTAAYLASNVTLNGLNWFWFSKMIETLRKRFDPPLGTRRPEEAHSDVKEHEKVMIEGTHVLTPAAVMADDSDYLRAGGDASANVVLEKRSTGTHLQVKASEVRSRTRTKRNG
ncbi:TLC domain-containing protein [Ampelomyces quisqualis]|uniref:TLC domain-containing protein n=1 Tax=Ampelomyces quisqualis TaxID=50730 RepID=A0A6A5QB24_AMPQU|nr:TLC domain-containing protein [Ampelomyces quisqualis]